MTNICRSQCIALDFLYSKLSRFGENSLDLQMQQIPTAELWRYSFKFGLEVALVINQVHGLCLSRYIRLNLQFDLILIPVIQPTPLPQRHRKDYGSFMGRLYT
jgi:hypothetical protein